MGIHHTILSTFLNIWKFYTKCWRGESKEGEEEFSPFLYEYKCWLQPTEDTNTLAATGNIQVSNKNSTIPGRGVLEVSNAQWNQWRWLGVNLRRFIRRLGWQRRQIVTKAREKENGGCYEVNVKTCLWTHVWHILGYVPSYTTKLSISLFGTSVSHKCWKYSLESEAICCVWHVKLKKSFYSYS